MKKIFYLMTAAALACGCVKDVPDDEEGKSSSGTIYGVITDKATGEPVRSAGVTLSPSGAKNVTGSEGQYEFTGLKAGEYAISATKTGYTDLVSYKITVEARKINKGDVQLEKLPPSLRVVNNSKQNVDSLVFGAATGDITRSFNIFNDGAEGLQWEITETSEWITKMSRSEGSLSPGAVHAVVATIDREKLNGGYNSTMVHITSNNGSKELKVSAIGQYKKTPVLTADSVANITSSAAVFYGTIINVGSPTYTERGFVYAETTAPTVETAVAKITSPVSSRLSYTASAGELELGKRYYVRAYATNTVGTAYSSNEVTFEPAGTQPSVRTNPVTNKNIGNGSAILNGSILTVGDPAYTERGFAYGTVHNPTVDDSKKAVSGTGTGAFSANLTDLPEGVVYYVRAYATNAVGTVYGSEESLDFNGTLPTVSTGNATNKNIG
ncbi:MAG: carboxypeptidase-like regulatory domain-containing protein, partial [Prevotellaceae bacterium]|nr:carboxypeptidase-like regulatory domain-containing protein [Prevotellaceae bacterium]